jgi:hypothetical protein
MPVNTTSEPTTERLAEIGEILARGLVRLRDRQSSRTFGDGGESSLACPAQQSGDATPENGVALV